MLIKFNLFVYWHFIMKYKFFTIIWKALTECLQVIKLEILNYISNSSMHAQCTLHGLAFAKFLARYCIGQLLFHCLCPLNRYEN